MEKIDELIRKIEDARSSIVNKIPSNFWVCAWLYLVFILFVVIAIKLDTIIELAK